MINIEKISRKQAKQQNITKYFTGKKCLRGHIAYRTTANGQCLECFKLIKPLSDKKYRQKNIGRLREYDKNRPKRKRNPEIVKVAKNRHYEKHKEIILAKQAEHRILNKEHYCKYFKKYKKENAGKVRYWGACREAAKINRTPKWLTSVDKERIQNEYKLASLLTKITGESWHVDHIIPLQGKLVSGLHVPGNLKAIRGSENVSKNNKWEPM